VTSRLGMGKSLTFFTVYAHEAITSVVLTWSGTKRLCPPGMFFIMCLSKKLKAFLLYRFKNCMKLGPGARGGGHIETAIVQQKKLFPFAKVFNNDRAKTASLDLVQQLSHCSKYFICLLFLFLFILKRLPISRNDPMILQFSKNIEILQ
jgi:hypothetical protein